MSNAYQLIPSEEGREEASNIHDSDARTVSGGVEKTALRCLLLQHLSSTFTGASYDFAAFLFLIEVFRDTLVPASLVGLFTKLTGLILSGYMGGLVDVHPRLKLLRYTIGAEKTFKAINYTLFLVLFGPLSNVAQSAFHGQSSILAVLGTWSILLCTIACSALLGLANTTMEVAIERDWIMTIAQGDGSILTELNTSMRRIDLLSKLVAPLFVSLLTTFGGYTFATTFLLGWVVVTCLAEYIWIEVVYRRFPILVQKRNDGEEMDLDQEGSGGSKPSRFDAFKNWIRGEYKDWKEFSCLPVFCSSVAIAAIYLTTLSYDGTFIAYIKAIRGYDDTFIALMRGLCVLTGLLGTYIMPRLERLVGLERAGAWSIWFEVTALLPAVLAFFIYTQPASIALSGLKRLLGDRLTGDKEIWNELFMFGGIALSRIGLWSFDLCQLKELQQALDSHPRRNRLTALQISLQNTFDLLKYALTLSAGTPSAFKWTALVSWLAVLAGAGSYAVFLRKVRGHLIHFEWLKKA